MYLKPNQMHEYLTPVIEIVSVDPDFIYHSPLSIRLFENNQSTSSDVSGSECSESDSTGESESATAAELPLFDNPDDLRQQKLRIDEQFDLAAYITGANTDFNYLQSPCHSESDTFDYVDRWLNDCLKDKDIPAESIEAIVWSKQECDLNVLAKENSFEPKLDFKTASNSCDKLAPVKSICLNPPNLNLPSKTVGIGRGKNLSMFIKINHHESSCDSASDIEIDMVSDTKAGIAQAGDPMVTVADVTYPDEIKENKSIVQPKLTIKAELQPIFQPVHSNVMPETLNNLTGPIQQHQFIVKTESKPLLRIAQEPELPCMQATISDTKPLTVNISTSDFNEGNTQATGAKEIKKKIRLNLDEYLKRRRGHKENCNVLANRSLNDEKLSAIKLETTDKNVSADDVKPNLDSLNLEEIIIVSMGTNTDISIPPNSQYHNDATNNTDLSHILKSNYLFDINDTIIKANGENVKISNNSLIASIQDVLLKKCKPNGNQLTSISVKAENGDVHGEDKTIMHLRKDRIRVATRNVDVQTDCLLMFPMLRKSIDSGRSSMRDSTTKYSDSERHRGRSIDNDHKRSCSPDSDSSLSSPHKSRRYGGSSRSPSYNKYNYYKNGSYKRKRNYGSRQDSSSRSDSDSSQSENSRILHNSYSDVQSKYSFKNNNDQHSNHQRKNIEERRIVYVGRIEQNTTKDDLKMKFKAYGPIKQITLHHKENGMKFGFVTYENANDAYRAIDCSLGDATINMYDISFGGRRAFCKATYMDLDGTISSQSTFTKTAPPKSQPDSFEDLLKKMKDKLCQKRALESP